MRQQVTLKTVRCDVVGARREQGRVVAYTLSCGHEFSCIGKGNVVYREERLCKECTEEKYGKKASSKG